MVDSYGYDRKTLSEAPEQGHLNKKGELGNATEGRYKQATAEKSAGQNLGETAARKFQK